MYYIVKKVSGKNQWIVIEKAPYTPQIVVGVFKSHDEAEDFAQRIDEHNQAMESYDYDY